MKAIKKILIIDDDEAIRVLLKKLLTKPGFAIYEIDSIKKALEKVTEIEPHIILLDINFPLMSGYSFLEWKKSNLVLNKTAIIMMSSNSDRDSILRAMALGADDYVVKPIQPYVLIKKIKKALLKLGKEANSVESVSPKEAAVILPIQYRKMNDTVYLINVSAKIAKTCKIEFIGENSQQEKGLFSRTSEIASIGKGYFRAEFSAFGDGKHLELGPSIQGYDNEDVLIKKRPIAGVVDDDPAIIELMKVFFSRYNCKMISYTSVAKILSAQWNDKIDLFLIDLSLQKTNDGFSAIEKIRGMHPDLPILVITGSQDQKALSHSVELGADDYILKPIKKDLFIAKIARLLDTKASLPKTTSKSLENPKDGFVRVFVSIEEFDEIGVYLHSKSLICKGTYLELQIENLNLNIPIRLQITSSEVEIDKNAYRMYAEFSDLEIEAIDAVKKALRS